MRRLLRPEALSGLSFKDRSRKATSRRTPVNEVAFLLSGSSRNRMNADIFANLRLAAWRDALRVLAVQLAAFVIGSAIATVGWGVSAGLGVLIGAGIGLLANAYTAIALLGRPLARQQAGGVLIGWLVRVGLIVSLTLIAMRAQIVPPLALILGLATISVAHWLAVSFWLNGRR
jgi:hypothetical protein